MMSNETNEPPESSSELDSSSRFRGLHKQLKEAGDNASEAAGKRVKAGGSWLRTTGQQTQTAVTNLPNRLGEDYTSILEQNPLVIDTLSRQDLLVDNKELLETAFNIPWQTTLLWSTAAGTTLALQEPLAKGLGQLAHYGPGHVARWKEINQFMDSVAGRGHRLKAGHSIDYLPQVVEKFGLEGVPAFTMHLVQDFATTDGIPVVPRAWDLKSNLEILGLSRKASVGLVSLSFTSLLSALALVALVGELWKFGDSLIKRIRVKKYIQIGQDALAQGDYTAAVQNYEKARDADDNPAIMMALGGLYMRRQANRYKAFEIFQDASRLLANQPDRTVAYHGAQLSLRGLANIQSLATSDVLELQNRDSWYDLINDMVSACIYSFTSAANKQAGQSADIVPDSLVKPAQFSAALNYYLAARAASLYPFGPKREEATRENLQNACRALRLMAQQDEASLLQPAATLQKLWTLELLSPEEAGHVLDGALE